MTMTQLDAIEDDADDAGDAEEWLIAREAAEHLGVSMFTLRGLARRGELPAYRSPLDRRATFYKIEDLDALEMEPVAPAAPKSD